MGSKFILFASDCGNAGAAYVIHREQIIKTVSNRNWVKDRNILKRLMPSSRRLNDEYWSDNDETNAPENEEGIIKERGRIKKCKNALTVKEKVSGDINFGRFYYLSSNAKQGEKIKIKIWRIRLNQSRKLNLQLASVTPNLFKYWIWVCNSFKS